MSRRVEPRCVSIQVEIGCPACGARTFARFHEWAEVGDLLVSGKWSSSKGCNCPGGPGYRIQAGALVEVTP